MVLNQDLHHNVLELDVHDGSHGLFLRPEQGRAEHHAQVGHRHQILLVVTRHAAHRPPGYCETTQLPLTLKQATYKLFIIF